MHPPNDDDFLLDFSPETFGSFRVLHQIGVGTLGPVFRTHQAGRDRLVAVKVFKLHLTPEQVRLLDAELARVVGLQLDHPSIVTALASGVEQGTAYLAQEYVAGDPLDVAVRQLGPLPIEDVLRLVAQLAGALDVAAAAGVFHGALHLRDVLVTEGDARLTGLGVAQALESAGAQAPLRRAYTAPERFAGGAWGSAADLYSLAAIAHELLFGRPVPGGPKDAADQLRDTAGAGSSLVEVLATGLSLDPVRRHETAAAFARELHLAATHPPRTVSPGARQIVPSVEPETLEPMLGTDDRGKPLELLDPLGQTLEIIESESASELNDTVLDLFSEEHASKEPVSNTPSDARPPLTSAASEPGVFFDEPSPPEAPAPPRLETAPLKTTAPSEPIGEGRRSEPSVSSPVFETDSPHERSSPKVAASSAAGARHADEVPLWLHETQPTIGSRTTGTRRPAVWLAVAALLAIIAAGFYFAARARFGGGESQADSSATREWTETDLPSRAPTSPAIEPKPPASATPKPAPETGSPTQKARSPAAGARPPAVPATALPAASGRLLVRSTPAGAVVTIDGQRRGTTPLAIRDMALGTYTIQVSREGYQPVESRVSLSKDRPSGSLALTLPAATSRAAPASTTRSGFGSIAVLSRPPGATVYLDERPIGETPLSAAEVAAGSHRIRIELAGHRRWATTVNVVPGERARVAASLEVGDK